MDSLTFMFLELLNLLFGAALGTASSEAYIWFRQKAGENNHDIQRALLSAYREALKVIRDYCQAVPDWEREREQIEARLDQMERDALEILGIVETQREQIFTAFEMGSFGAEIQQQVTIALMNRLESEDKWLKEAPPALSNAVRSLLIPAVVHQFRQKLKNDAVVFRTLIHDMLAAVGKSVSDVKAATQKTDQQFDNFIGLYSADVNSLLKSITQIDGQLAEFDGILQQLIQQMNTQTSQPRPVPLQFESLIADKTKGFVGREFVFSAIENFFQRQPKGYFIIVADPGVGKSAILAEYVRRTRCVAYFNQRTQGSTRVEEFLKSVCAQLIERHNLPYSVPLHPDNTRDGNFLVLLLHELSAQLQPGQKLVIAVDALDEVDLKSQNTGSNVLYLPEALPNNVYFLLTRRPKLLPLLVNDEDSLDLTQYQQESLQDIKRYIQQQIQQSSSLLSQISKWGLTVDDFITMLSQKSENNFMYLRYVLPEIEKGTYPDLTIESLPRGLQNYYYQHWGRMGMLAKPLPRTKIKIIYVLTEVYQPISLQLITEFAQEDVLTVQEVLDKWQQFLHEQHVDGETRYSVYHTSFHDFLHEQKIVQAVKEAGVTIENINAQIATNLAEELGL